MEARTDLALELKENLKEELKGRENDILVSEKKLGSTIKVTRVEVVNESGSRIIKKPVGKYITIETFGLDPDEESEMEAFIKCISDNINSICTGKRAQSILVAGLGNKNVTPDRLGPMVTDNLFITGHTEKNPRLYAIAPGVTGQTGMETAKLISVISDSMKPELVIAVDALAAVNVRRLASTVQISDTGICPGSGVGNDRKEISSNTLKVPVIAIGVPTVIDARAMTQDESLKGLIVMPHNIDERLRSISYAVAQGINRAIFG